MQDSWELKAVCVAEARKAQASEGWRGVTVTDPFAGTPHALLRTLVGDDERDEVQKDDP